MVDAPGHLKDLFLDHKRRITVLGVGTTVCAVSHLEIAENAEASRSTNSNTRKSLHETFPQARNNGNHSGRYSRPLHVTDVVTTVRYLVDTAAVSVLHVNSNDCLHELFFN